MDHQAFAQLLGNYGEFVGAIAVVVTLVYLAVQVRHSSRVIETNTGLVRADSWTSMVQMQFEFDRLLIASDEVMGLWLRGGNEEKLSEIDHARWLRLVFARFDLARALYQRAKIGGTPPLRFVDVLAREIVSLPGLATVWGTTLGLIPDHLPDRDFVSAVNDRIAELGGKTNALHTSLLKPWQ